MQNLVLALVILIQALGVPPTHSVWIVVPQQLKPSHAEGISNHVIEMINACETVPVSAALSRAQLLKALEGRASEQNWTPTEMEEAVFACQMFLHGKAQGQIEAQAEVLEPDYESR